jgi:hypothetical protein
MLQWVPAVMAELRQEDCWGLIVGSGRGCDGEGETYGAAREIGKVDCGDESAGNEESNE